MLPTPLFAGLFLGWALGANDAANVFGTAVASRAVSFRTAALLCGLAIVLGAYLQGEAGIATYRELALQSLPSAVLATCSTALTVTFMTWKRLPVSVSQAMVGAIMGVGLATDTVQWGVLHKVLVCWIATPIGALLLSWPLYYLIAGMLALVPIGILTRDKILWNGLIIAGVYGAYALGANNVANSTAVFSGQLAGISDQELALWGGIAMAAGVISYGKRVMLAVGGEVMRLNAFTALIVVLANAATVHIFAALGVPVSSSQAIVGAIIGVGFLRNPAGLNYRLLGNIAMGWLLTPVVSLVLTAAGFAVFVR